MEDIESSRILVWVLAMNDKEEVSRAYNAGLRLLSYRLRSRYEMEQRLGQRFPLAAARSAVEVLEGKGYLDDARFARAWKESQDGHRPQSSSMIRRKLLQRGISEEIVGATVVGIDDEQNAYRLASKRRFNAGGVATWDGRRRLWNYLRGRGFTGEIVRKTVKRLLDETAPQDLGPG